jgi:hypothetical protein
MRLGKTSVSNWLFLALLVALLGWSVVTPTPVQGQNCSSTANPAGCQGWNGVYLSGSSKSPTYAFVDAAPYMTDTRCSSNTGGCDICDAIGLAFKDYNTNNSNGVLIDARGIATPQACTNVPGSYKYPNPWSVVNSFSAPYNNIVLLPTGTIYLEQTWVLTTNTRLVGEGANLTTIQPCTTAVCGNGQAFSSTDMIEMGSGGSTGVCSGNDCQGVVVEHLGLNGNSQSGINGIVNLDSQELSRVDDVSLTNMGASTGTGTGIGLYINGLNTYGYISNSGPYSNIYYAGSGICADITNPHANGLGATRGIHGLTCIMSGTETTPAVYVDSPNNSLEDVYISGNSSQDGILIGSAAGAGNNVLFNIRGNGLKNVIHISSNSTGSVYVNCPPQNGSQANACDLTALGVTALTTGTNTIQDDLTSTTVSSANVALYIVGEPVQAGTSNVGYTRFTTSLGVPTWLVGSGSPGTGSCTIGSLYSETSGTDTLWGCRGVSGVGSWHDIN